MSMNNEWSGFSTRRCSGSRELVLILAKRSAFEDAAHLVRCDLLGETVLDARLKGGTSMMNANDVKRNEARVALDI